MAEEREDGLFMRQSHTKAMQKQQLQNSAYVYFCVWVCGLLYLFVCMCACVRVRVCVSVCVYTH